MVTPKGRPARETLPTEKRGRVPIRDVGTDVPKELLPTEPLASEHRGRTELRDVGKDPVDVPDAEVSPTPGGGFDVTELLEITKRARHDFLWPGTTIQETVTISTVTAVKSLPSVVIVGIPADATIRFARALLLYREVTDTSGTLNDLNGATNIQVRLSGGTFTDAINLVNQQFQVPASERGPGDVLIGDIDLTCEVTGDGTYNFQFATLVSTGSNLILRDVQVALQVMWS